MIRFSSLQYTHGFWIIVFLSLFLFLAFKKRRQLMLQFAKEQTLKRLVGTVNFKNYIIKAVISVAVLVFALFALIRPQWGFKWQEVKRQGLDILIAIDTSKSMLAQDVRPNRLERSKLAVKDLVKKLTGDRIGLIAFAGRAFLQCPLTIDYNGFMLALDDLDAGIIPVGGTSISQAITTALKSYQASEGKHRILIIITDGEDHQGDTLAFAKQAKEKGVKIFSVGIGTAEGELIQLTDETGKNLYLKDAQGNVVKSRLNEEVLKQIALTTGGAYVRSSGAEFGLDYIYQDKLSKIEKREIKAEMAKLYHERFQIPLIIAFLFLLMEPMISIYKKE